MLKKLIGKVMPLGTEKYQTDSAGYATAIIRHVKPTSSW